jgi:hypothetical protein
MSLPAASQPENCHEKQRTKKRQIDMKRFILLLVPLLANEHTFADMGSIPFIHAAKVLEPNQRALIAWNGTEQILILTTDLQSDRETKVLEIMPCPSEPTIQKAKAEVFQQATDLINMKLPRNPVAALSASAPESLGGPDMVPAGRVTSRQRIGAHDVSTTHVERPEDFVKWAQDYLKKQGVDNPMIPPSLAKVIEEYIEENFTWFVFDVVSLSKEPVTKEALQFRFKTEFLFYPMRITKTEQGDTTVTLLILTPRLIDSQFCLGIPPENIQLVHQPVILTGVELQGLSKDIFNLLGNPKSIPIRNWQIRGRLDSFTDDVIVGDPRAFIRHLRGQSPEKALTPAQPAH